MVEKERGWSAAFGSCFLVECWSEPKETIWVLAFFSMTLHKVRNSRREDRRFLLVQ